MLHQLFIYFLTFFHSSTFFLFRISHTYKQTAHADNINIPDPYLTTKLIRMKKVAFRNAPPKTGSFASSFNQKALGTRFDIFNQIFWGKQARCLDLPDRDETAARNKVK